MSVITLVLFLLSSFSFAYEPHFSISAPWSMTQTTEHEWIFRNDTHPASLVLRSQDGALGLTLVHQNRAFHTTLSGKTIPLLAPPFKEAEMTLFHVESQGIDLVIRLEGPSLQEWTGVKTAPTDPLLSWTRVRVRQDRWRFMMNGVQRLTLPANHEGPHPIPDPQGGISFDHGFGHWTYKTEAVAIRGQKTSSVWYMDTSPSVHWFKPYPKTILEWTPRADTPRP